MTALSLANLRGLRRAFRLESQRLQLPQGVRAVLAISVPIGLGLAFHQLAAAVIVTLGAWISSDHRHRRRLSAKGYRHSQCDGRRSLRRPGCLHPERFAVVESCRAPSSGLRSAAFLGVFGNSAATVSFLDLADVCHYRCACRMPAPSGYEFRSPSQAGFGRPVYPWRCGHCTPSLP